MLGCTAISEIDKSVPYCGIKASYFVTWSDREIALCLGHKGYVYECYDTDQKYDQTGMDWLNLVTNERWKEG